MKKLFALLLVLSMLAMLCACGSGTVETNQPTAAAEQTEVKDEAPAESTAGEDTLATEVKEILGDAISFDDYEVAYQDEEMVNLDLLDWDRIELDYIIDLDDGTTIQLPMVYSELLDAGWASNVQWEENAESNSMGSTYLTNADGKTIFVSIINPTSETMKVMDIWVNNVVVGGDFTEGFDIHGISEGSSVADVIAAWGKPYNISYFKGENYVDLELNYSALDGSLSINIDSQTGLVSSVTYGFSSGYIE